MARRQLPWIAVLLACGLGSCASYEYRQLSLASPLLRVELTEREITPARIAEMARQASGEDWVLESVVAVFEDGDRERSVSLEGCCDDFGNVWIRLLPGRFEQLLRSRATLTCKVGAGSRTWSTECRLLVPDMPDEDLDGLIGTMLVTHWQREQVPSRSPPAVKDHVRRSSTATASSSTPW